MARILVTEAIADGGLDRLRARRARRRRAARAVARRAALGDRRRARADHPFRDTGRPPTSSPPRTSSWSSVEPGIGLDNVDVAAATERGVMVVNAPQSNIISAAEHTMALLLAQARNVPQAHAALVAGRWERSKWEGVELADKTLGIVGLGRIGKLVADRAKAFADATRRLRPVRVRRPCHADGRRVAARSTRSIAAVRLPDDPPAEDEGDGGPDQSRSAPEGEADAARHQRRPRWHRRRGRSRGVHPRRCDRRCGTRRVRRPSRRPSRRCSSCRRSSSRHTSAHRPARRRTRPATRSPTWCSSPSPVTSCRGPSTSTPPRRTRRSARSCRSPRQLGRLYGSLHGSTPDSFEFVCQGEIAGTTRASWGSPCSRASSAASPTSRSATSTRRAWRRRPASRCARSSAPTPTSTST